ncbi:hypothetical protein K503DRAFT_61401 [Rhizopogon vinicolor AM-OR11-026]|uniref:Cytidyltransferase-like domain-containing protein n=1 Tax=Rhizopogon vinicolor AM-OR11-026 TaxID=1314800 RepID=A0A1B7N4D5_9AGAM|nr:hypothetical protein K503DRAFT_61401 [Rhizopogon vinicolor AM-OR11-026]
MKPNLFSPSGHALKLLQKVQRQESTVELVYTSHERWPFSPLPVHPQPKPDTIRISVLDSSFNPPTSAHLALVNLMLRMWLVTFVCLCGDERNNLCCPGSKALCSTTEPVT